VTIVITYIPGNVDRFTCYVCKETTTDMWVTNLNYPYDYMCSPCFAKSLNSHAIRLSGEASCSDCGDDEPMYCERCYTCQYESGQENANSTCDDCGSGESVYCSDCAPSNWGLVDPEYLCCEQCGATTPVEVLCPDCIRKRLSTEQSAISAQAAEAIEVAWE